MSSYVPVPSVPCLRPEQLRGLLVHVDAEEVSLRNMMRLLQELPAQATDEIQQREMRIRIDQSLQHAAFLAQNRSRVITALGQLLGIAPENVSFSALLPFSTPAAVSLLVPARQRLQRIVRQLRVLVNSVAWVVSESRRIQLTIFQSLPGAAGSDRYDASGQKNLNPASFRFETRS